MARAGHALIALPACLTVVVPAAQAQTTAQDGVATDRAVLEALYEATGGPVWTDDTNWNTDAPLGEWYGVTTDADGRVIWLQLHENRLSGPIPSSLGNLSNLAVLWLGINELSGPIPLSLGSLSNLKVLWLGDNELSGPIPSSLGNLSNLEGLSLGGNELSGPIPSSLGGLSNLRELYLTDNELSGPVPSWLGGLSNLEKLRLGGNELSGPIPSSLGRLSNLEELYLANNELSGPIPLSLGDLSNLTALRLHGNWGLSGPLPSGLRQAPLVDLDLLLTQACAPRDWQAWLTSGDVDFLGALCGARPDVTIDVAVVYTPAARAASGGAAAIEAVIDLMVAETNQAYADSGVNHRVALVAREEVSYTETGDVGLDLDRLRDPSDGHMDGVHALRDRVGADLLHLIVDRSDFGGIGDRPGAFGLTGRRSGGRVFAHETGHNMGLDHDRYAVRHNRDGKYQTEARRLWAHPAYGYENPRAFEEGSPASSLWFTIMSYGLRCKASDGACNWLLRFSNPRHRYDGDPLGVPFGAGGSGFVDGPADAVAVLNATGPAVALWRDRPGANRPPARAGNLADRTLAMDATLDVDVSQAFADPDGDRLAYGVSSSASRVVTVAAAGARITLTAVGEGTAVVTVTATDPGGLSATQSFGVRVRVVASFTDDPIRPGVTSIRVVHFTELRARVDALRQAAGLARLAWTDPVLTAGVTRVRLVHLLELRSALAEAYAAADRPAPLWTDAAPSAGSTPIRAVHVTELRSAVRALE